MKICPHCQAQLDDAAAFCNNCGSPLAPQQPQQPQQSQQPQQPQQPVYAQPAPQPRVDPYDHTAEFEAEDISKNKVVCMLAYLWGVVGIIIAVLVGKESPYTAFHVRQSMKFSVLDILLGLAGFAITTVLCKPIELALGMLRIVLPLSEIVWLLIGLALVALLVVKVITFFQVCGGKAKEPAIVRSIGFLK